MSPASAGALEVERYIGACLISSQGRSKGANQVHHHDVYAGGGGGYVNLHHHQQQQQQRCGSVVDGWAGGMPLISFMSSQRRRRPDVHQAVEEQQKTLSRLAIHTQGAPLILSGRHYNPRKAKETRPGQTRQQEPKKFVVQGGGRGGGASNRNNHGGGVGVVRGGVSDSVSVASDESSGSGNSENCLPRIIKPRKRRKKDRKPPAHLARVDTASLSSSSASNSPEIEPYRDEPVYFCDFVKAAEISVDCGDVPEAPKLHHSFEEVEGEDDATPGGDTSSCQCRYCDPSGQIWDVDRRCYSPFLTLPSLSNYHLFSFGGECLVERMSNVSLSGTPSKTKSHLGDLEVSTEIVTSLNGHRDLEIKFFSTPASNVDANAKSAAKCGVGDTPNVFLTVEE